MQVFIFDKYFQQLYPFSVISKDDLAEIKANENRSLAQPIEISGDRYLLSFSSEKNGLLYDCIISKKVMLKDVIKTQRIFTIVWIALVFLGGVFVYIFAFLNYRPIKKLSKLATDKVFDIPGNLYDTDKIFFALEKLDNNLVNVSHTAHREKLIYRLIHGEKFNRQMFEDECARAGIYFSSCYMRVVLFFYEGECVSKGNIDVINNVEQILSSQYEICGIEYLENNCYLFIIGYDTERREILENQLNAVASNLSQYVEGNIKVTVGGPCTAFIKLSESYFQAVLISKLSSFSTCKNVTFYEDNNLSDVKFIYPKIELDALFNHIVNADIEKVKLITGILVNMIYANCNNKFVSLALCYDIINTYLNAIDELNMPGANREYSYNKYRDFCNMLDIRSFVDIIIDLQSQVETMLTANSRTMQTDNLVFKAITYIDSHYKDSDLCVNTVANHFNVSISNLSHQFKSITGSNISDYINDKKLTYAKELLRDTDTTINDVAFLLGYNHTSNFIRKFKQCVNMTPNEYRMKFGGTKHYEENCIS